MKKRKAIVQQTDDAYALQALKDAEMRYRRLSRAAKFALRSTHYVDPHDVSRVVRITAKHERVR